MRVDISVVAKVFNVLSTDDIDTLEENYKKFKFLKEKGYESGLLHHKGGYDVGYYVFLKNDGHDYVYLNYLKYEIHSDVRLYVECSQMITKKGSQVICDYNGRQAKQLFRPSDREIRFLIRPPFVAVFASMGFSEILLEIKEYDIKTRHNGKIVITDNKIWQGSYESFLKNLNQFVLLGGDRILKNYKDAVDASVRGLKTGRIVEFCK